MNPRTTERVALAVYCGRAGDHNDRAMPGAAAVGLALSARLGVAPEIIGMPSPARYAGWEAELARARPTLIALADHLDILFRKHLLPICAFSRCAVSLASLPVLMRHRPDACVVWLDAHGDLNTPDTTLTGYLGGMALAGPAGLWDSGLGHGLPGENIILLGARDLDPAEQALLDAGKVALVAPGGDVLAQLRRAVGGRPVYVHLDCDVLEPGIVPTDYRVPDGFSLDELHAICEVLAETELLGLEIAEFENTWPDNPEPVSPGPLLQALSPLLPQPATG